MRKFKAAAAALRLTASVALVCVVAAGCSGGGGSASGSGNASVTPTDGGSAVPGHGSPEQAVAGALQAALAGDYSQACSYMAPSGQSECAQQATNDPSLSGSYHIVDQVIEGDKALVFVTGTACNGPSDCFTSSASDASSAARVARGPNGFNFYYQYFDTQSSGGGNFSPLSCIEVDGLWYLNANGLFIEGYLS